MFPRKRHSHNLSEPSPNTASLPTTAVSRETSSSRATANSEPISSNQRMPPPLPASDGTKTPVRVKDDKQVRKAQSWYGSWPRAPKASASTSLARENIFVATVKPNGMPDLGRYELKRNGDDAASLRSTASATRTLVKTPENSSNGEVAKDTPETPKIPEEPEVLPEPDHKVAQDEPIMKAEDKPVEDQVAEPEKKPEQATGWLSWWNPLSTETAEEVEAAMVADPCPKKEIAKPIPLPVEPAPLEQPVDPPAQDPVAATLWFNFWSPSSEDKAKPEIDEEPKPDVEPEPVKEPENVSTKDVPSRPQTPQHRSPPPKAGSTWAFWSRDSPTAIDKIPGQDKGEIAVIGEGSEMHPTPIVEGDVTQAPVREDPAVSGVKEVQRSSISSWRKGKTARPQSLDINARPSSAAGITTPTTTEQGPEKASQPMVEQPQSPAKTQITKKPTAAEIESTTKQPPNLLLPSFSSTYSMKESPSILKQITGMLLNNPQPPAKHVFRVKEPPRIRKAIAIGVHGLFPATYLRPMIGQPTGTSLRFSSLCAEAIRRWADAHGSWDCEIEKVALEGDGRINDRVENLWKLMVNWIDHIREADLIVIACHSQGVPVSIMLLEKLIELGIITHAKVGVCAMAGVALGPFPDYKSSILMGSAAELWDFGNPQSHNSQRFETCLKRVLDYGARITFIGSIDDQLVPMESAVYSPASHPYIYRAVFIDGRIHAPDFIAHLVGFALKLRNLGIPDHGLICELSAPLAGSLYSGEGHSRLYYDDAVYDLAIMHALETTRTSQQVPCDIPPREAASLTTPPNPYVLPWIMRGLLEEEFVKKQLRAETEELLRQFDDWKPTNKALKDVKYRLEAVRSKL